MFDYHNLNIEILGRTNSIFQEDYLKSIPEITEKIKGSKILILGAAGSIGSAFTKLICDYEPSIIHAVDINENNLVELVRNIRSSNLKNLNDFETFVLDYGSGDFIDFINYQKNYDYILNFTAIKHIRSERNVFTIKRLFNVNNLYLFDFLNKISNYDIKKFFSISTDKAVYPVSIMGVSKLFMEKILLYYSENFPVSTTRLANVAFSNGSLLFGFFYRLINRQPIAVPNDIYRYLISDIEASQICCIAVFCSENKEILIPKITTNFTEYKLSDIALNFIEYFGYKPRIFYSEQEAKNNTEIIKNNKLWPLYFFKADTSGERGNETFHYDDESINTLMFENIDVIERTKAPIKDDIDDIIFKLHNFKKNQQISKKEYIKLFKYYFSEFRHIEKDKNLDQKM